MKHIVKVNVIKKQWEREILAKGNAQFSINFNERRTQ